MQQIHDDRYFTCKISVSTYSVCSNWKKNLTSDFFQFLGNRFSHFAVQCACKLKSIEAFHSVWLPHAPIPFFDSFESSFYSIKIHISIVTIRGVRFSNGMEFHAFFELLLKAIPPSSTGDSIDSSCRSLLVEFSKNVWNLNTKSVRWRIGKNWKQLHTIWKCEVNIFVNLR